MLAPISLSRFEPPFDSTPFSTPYNLYDFPSQVKDFCEQQKVLYSKGSRKNAVEAKAILLGDCGVGKTTLVHRFLEDKFCHPKATVHCDFGIGHSTILGVPFNLTFWDTAGIEEHGTMFRTYFRNLRVAVIVFEFTKINSFANVKQWKKILDDNTESKDQVFLFMVGTKMDALEPHLVEEIEEGALDLAARLDMEYWPVSSKTGANVTRLFRRIATMAFCATVEKLIEDSFKKEKEKEIFFLTSSKILAKSRKSKRGFRFCSEPKLRPSFIKI